MKRKNIDDFYKPVKITKQQVDEQVGGKNEENVAGEEKKKVRAGGKVDAFMVIMKTPQVTQRDNFHLEYVGFENFRHKWKYGFGNVSEGRYRSKTHNLKMSATDVNAVVLSFSTDHIGSAPHFYELTRRGSFYPSLLKSLLQKAVRRKNLSSSLMTSLQISVNCGIQELARRLCIIVIEDACLHPDFPLLVWCMGVNDYNYSQEILDSILQIVSDLTLVDYKDNQVPSPVHSVYDLWKDGDIHTRCLLIRAFYRGMKGDVKMLTDFASIWKLRSQSQDWSLAKEEIYSDLRPIQSSDFEKKLKLKHVLNEGVDFHCSDMINWLVDRLDIASSGCPDQESFKKYLKEAIWTHRSSINYRKPLEDHPKFSALLTKPAVPEAPAVPEVPEAPEATPDLFFTRQVLPLIESYSSSELDKRLKLN